MTAPLDYRALGLKVGLEIHQQLSTGKLFCSCPCELSEEVLRSLYRMLRPSQSEMGETDRAALEEAQKRLSFVYQSTRNDCLVEADEEPPHAASMEAVKTVLMFSEMVAARPVDEIQFMRKIVIDGSNTGGFQRTALISMDGEMELSGKKIGIETICLEEDAGRRISEDEGSVTFRLDRLGMPLIEIATSPVIETPEESRAVARRIGSLLRATRRVRRGIGSIREDVNISISAGARVEIKGVQELEMLPEFVRNEVLRQLALVEVRDELRARGITEVPDQVRDLSGLLSKSKSKVLMDSLANGGVVLAVLLPGFAGLMRPDGSGVKRIGRELAYHARVAGVGGVFHSDELPAYGMTESEVRSIREALDAAETDGFAIVAGPKERATAAAERVLLRARQALLGVPEETRDPLPDGTTAYSRPLPGSARMYPETDVPPLAVGPELLDEVKGGLPELPERTVARLQEEQSLSREQAEALVSSGYDLEFDQLVAAGISPRLAARTLINTLAEVEKEGIDISSIDVQLIVQLLSRVESGAFAKEAVPSLLVRMLRHREDVDQAMRALGLSGATDSDIEMIIDRIVTEKKALILERRERSIAPLMGLAMKELRGRADGQLVNRMLTERVMRALES